MPHLTKKRKAVVDKVDANKVYSLTEAMQLVKQVNTTKFDASVDVHVRLGIDPRKPDQAIRGTVTLPNGTGKTKKVLVFCSPDKVQEALDAGADYAGLEEYVQKVTEGWTDVDVVISTPNVMVQVGKLGRILGPRNLMPNPKTGTVTNDVRNAVEDVKKGKISFRVDKYGIIHNSVGRISFDVQKLEENATEFINTIMRAKPSSAKGTYLKGISIAGTMSPGIKIDIKTIKL